MIRVAWQAGTNTDLSRFGSVTSDAADRVIELYERHAGAWSRDRGECVPEARWLDRFLALLPPHAAVLDIGCGSGVPARYLIEQGCRVTGVDSSPSMIALCRNRFPEQHWHVADMRMLALECTFNGILAWDSFFTCRRPISTGCFRSSSGMQPRGPR